MHILLLDDDDDIRTLLRIALHKAAPDIRIDEAATLREAFRLLAVTAYDCMVMDQHLPDGTTLSLLQTISFPRSRLILFSSDGANPRIQIQATRLGVADVVSKTQPVKDVVRCILGPSGRK